MFDGMQPQQHQHKAARRRTGQVFDVRATEKETSGWPRLTEVEKLAACPNVLTLGPLPAVRAD
jgi:hypothetical protein